MDEPTVIICIFPINSLYLKQTKSPNCDAMFNRVAYAGTCILYVGNGQYLKGVGCLAHRDLSVIQEHILGRIVRILCSFEKFRDR